MQIGSDSDWQAVAAAYDHTLALKRNGSLWGWGELPSALAGENLSGPRLAPVFIGADAESIARAVRPDSAGNPSGKAYRWAWRAHSPAAAQIAARFPTPVGANSWPAW